MDPRMQPGFQPPDYQMLQHARENGYTLPAEMLPDTEGGPTYTDALQPTEPIVEPYEDPGERHDAEEAAETTEAEEAELVRKLEDQWSEAYTWWSPIHEKIRKCHEYYDGKQWTEKQRNERLLNGMPALVMNKVAKAIDNITGRERATRYDWKAAPLGADEVLAADAMTHGLKHISNQVNAKYAISDAFEDATKGYGVLEVWYDDTQRDEPDIRVDAVAWDRWYGDPFSRRRDQYDARYNIYVSVLDLDVAKAAWAAKAEALEAAVQSYSLRDQQAVLSDYDNTDDGRPYVGRLGGLDYAPGSRPRVLVREHQYWVLEHAEWWRMPDGKRIDAEKAPDPMSQAALLQAGGEFVRGLKRCYYIATVANEVLLAYRKSPYPYDRFSYVPLWCKRDKDGKPYGLVQLMLDAQNEINVNLSRANEAIRSRHLLYEPGALGTTTVDQAAQKLAQANFMMEVANINGVKIGTDAADAQMFVELMDRAEKFLDDIVGANDTAYGDPDNTAVSGKAKQIQVMQQGLTLGKLFDNLKFARLYVGEMLIALMQKHYTPQLLARIIHANVMQTAGVGVNALGQPKGAMPDVSWLDQAMAGDIMQLKFDVQVEDTGETATARQAEMQQRTDLMGVVPDEFKAPMLPGLIRAADWAGAEELAGQVEQQLQAMSQPQGPDIREFLNIDAAKCLSFDQMQFVLQKFGVPPSQIPPGELGSSVPPKPPEPPPNPTGSAPAPAPATPTPTPGDGGFSMPAQG